MTTNKEVAIEEMLRDAEEAAEPGVTKAGTVISQSQDMTMTAAELQSAGYVYVYDTITAKSSIVKSDFLTELDRLTHLKNRHPRAYATLELERTRSEREEDRLERMALTDSLREMNKTNTTKGSKNG